MPSQPESVLAYLRDVGVPVATRIIAEELGMTTRRTNAVLLRLVDQGHPISRARLGNTERTWEVMR